MSDVTGEPAIPSETAPTVVVERFLELLRLSDLDAAMELLAVDVRYENVGMPTVHGRERVRRLFRGMSGGGAGFDVRIHTLAAHGPSVMTERTDVLTFRRLHVQLWVCGRFDVQEGQIVLWRDYFDYVNFSIALARGLLGVRIPGLRAKLPATS